MIYKTLISAQDLIEHLNDPDWVIVDCRFSLEDSDHGRKAYLEAHIPGAVYAHLNDQLSGEIVPGRTGRHPLPEISSFVSNLNNWGIDDSVQVITYDDAGGALAAARLWWMLRWLGHNKVAVLDGGWSHWVKLDYPTRTGNEHRKPRLFSPNPQTDLLVTSEAIERMRQQPDYRLLDSRTSERFRGENETIDPVAGHIPGAISAPYLDNLDNTGQFHSPNTLKKRFEKLLAGVTPERAIFYCGSGVTAAHNLLAQLHIGMGEGKLYAGSWSEWITDPKRPVD
ncbi:MAG: sulfurtransferase [Anaerolineales bacterium]|nr:sulfurtransferase [Anaerolineales bacterium]